MSQCAVLHWRANALPLTAISSGLGDQNCAGRIALTLEGGYDLDALGYCDTAATQALLGQTWEDPLGTKPLPCEQRMVGDAGAIEARSVGLMKRFPPPAHS